MDILTIIVGGALALLLAGFLLRLTYTIFVNLSNGQKIHHALYQEFNKLRLSNMHTALGINKRAYIYQTRVNDIQQQMDNCKTCLNTDECDEKLSSENATISDISFCSNEAGLHKVKQQLK